MSFQRGTRLEEGGRLLLEYGQWADSKAAAELVVRAAGVI
jgi:hypothetical protein